MPITADSQQPAPGELVVLFDLDATHLGGSIYRFVQGHLESSVVTWRGNQYSPIDVVAEGFEKSTEGALPRPKLRISNVAKAMIGAVIQYDDLLGCRVTRWKTFRKYMDGQSSADPNAHYMPDIYAIERRTTQDKHAIEWELASIIDVEGQQLPRRQILRENCTHTYRYWTGSHWDYSLATCPYTASRYYDRNGNQVQSQADDRCGRKLSDCRLRFTGKKALPTTAFPGVARTRVY